MALAQERALRDSCCRTLSFAERMPTREPGTVSPRALTIAGEISITSGAGRT